MNNSSEEKVQKILDRMPTGMTKFQMRHFVIKDQPGILHQIRQVVNEIDVREATHRKFSYKLEKQKLEIEIAQEKLNKEKESLSEKEIRLKQMDLDHETWKLSALQRSVTGCRRELDYLYELMEELTQDVDVDHLLDNFDEYDEKYWVARLGKQGGVDMSTVGRISAGNLSAIELLPDELKQQSLMVAVNRATQHNDNMQDVIQSHEQSDKIGAGSFLDRSIME